MTITGQSSLNKDDIEQMVRDAESHAEEDRRRREEAEVRNQADTLVYQTEKLLREQGEKLEGAEKEQVEARLADLKSVKDGDDVEAVKTAIEGLATASQGFAQKLYESAAAEGGGDGAAAGGAGFGSADAPDDEEVVDAEIVDES